jgi:hypothetical protein
VIKNFFRGCICGKKNTNLQRKTNLGGILCNLVAGRGSATVSSVLSSNHIYKIFESINWTSVY